MKKEYKAPEVEIIKFTPNVPVMGTGVDGNGEYTGDRETTDGEPFSSAPL